MRKWFYSMACLLFFAMLVSCGPPEKAATSHASEAGKVQLTLWILNTGWEWIKSAVEDFEQVDPNIEVEVIQYEVDPIKEALKVAANTKTLPDMWFTWGGTLGSFYPENELSLDLTQIAEDHNWSEIYNKAAITMSTFDGRVSGIPLRLNVLGMWYPKSVFEKANTKPPKTFAEFEAQLEILKKSGFVPLAFGSKGGWHTMRLTEQLLEHFAGPELHEKLNNLEASWNTPAVVKTFLKLREYTDKGYFPKGYSSLDPSEATAMINHKQAGMSTEGFWGEASISSEGFDVNDYEVFKFPTDQTPARSSVFVEMIQLNAEMDAVKQAAAIKFGEYLSGVEVVNKYMEKFGSPSVLNSTLLQNTPHLETLLDHANEGGFLITDQALPQEVVKALFEAQDKVAFKEWTPHQAAIEMEKAANDYKTKKIKFSGFSKW